MIESRFEHRPPVDDLRLAEIEGLWEDCCEGQAACVEAAYAGDEVDVRHAVIDADPQINRLLQEMVPELIVELRRRNRREEENKHG